jgi:hypothetical protein
MSVGEAVNPPRERWFLKLYPREWRARYGAELAALVGDKPLSFGSSIDLIAGAIDARFTKGTKMPSVLKSVCLMKGEPQTAADGMRGAAVIIVGSLVFLGLATFARRSGWPETGDALAGMSFPVSLVLMTHVMYLRKQSLAVKTIITGGTLTFLIGISILNAL